MKKKEYAMENAESKDSNQCTTVGDVRGSYADASPKNKPPKSQHRQATHTHTTLNRAT